jgi:hypothetical protein
MPGSYRNVNYSLRPAKAIERKMLCEAFRRLHPFDRIESYRYIGFGSIYFSDFQLFHRSLGMEDMLSIEKDAHAKECFEFNKPYNCVRLDCRPATEVLPELDWAPRTIAWLDYDGKLDEGVLSDINSVAARTRSGSVLVVSVNSQADRDPDAVAREDYTAETGLPYDLDAYRLRELHKRIGDAVPPEVEGKDLRGKGVAAIYRQLIQSRIEEALSARNAAAAPDKKLTYEQIFNFIYSDGAAMLTVGGVFFEPGERGKFDACAFDTLNFTRADEAPYSIDVPCLTMKEIRHLNGQLPLLGDGAAPPPGVPGADVAKYVEIYRFFPTFAEAIFS